VSVHAHKLWLASGKKFHVIMSYFMNSLRTRISS